MSLVRICEWPVWLNKQTVLIEKRSEEEGNLLSGRSSRKRLRAWSEDAAAIRDYEGLVLRGRWFCAHGLNSRGNYSLGPSP